jgi:PncC family amidohydrolase
MTLSREVGKSLRAEGKKLALAESVTGGLVANMITDEPGASDFFLCGVVAYGNEAKVKLLGVRKATLKAQGAVSHQCALEMAKGARELARADIGASCTGIAGPTGATRTKPIGLVYIAVDDGKHALVEEEMFSGDRLKIKKATAERMLELILLTLKP